MPRLVARLVFWANPIFHQLMDVFKQLNYLRGARHRAKQKGKERCVPRRCSQRERHRHIQKGSAVKSAGASHSSRKWDRARRTVRARRAETRRPCTVCWVRCARRRAYRTHRLLFWNL